MAEPDASMNQGDKKEPDNTLNKMLIALQKSLSRVSAGSKDVPSENARALIMGNVEFELTVNVEPEGEDYLVYRPAGNVQLKLTGVIQQDIRAESEKPQDKSNEPVELQIKSAEPVKPRRKSTKSVKKQ